MRAFWSALLPGLALAMLAPTAGAAAPPERAAVPVAVITPRAARVTDELRLTGTLTAERSARLSPRVDGLVARLRVEAGDRVRAGAPLLELDAQLATLALRRAAAGTQEAEARRAEAERLATEARRLVAEGHLPQTEVARRESEAKLAAAAHAAATAAEREQQELVRRHVLVAPFAGVVARRLTDVGEWVARGTPVLELVATDRVRLDLQAPQERYADLGDGASVRVYAPGAGDAPLTGKIVARVPVTDATSRTFLVRVLVDAGDRALLPGTSATAVLSPPSSRSALVIPRDAVLRYPDGTHSVFVVREESGRATALERRVQLGRGGTDVEVLDGLEATDRVVVRGNEALRSGQPVRIATAGT